jgi:hypothetical protein
VANHPRGCIREDEREKCPLVFGGASYLYSNDEPNQPASEPQPKCGSGEQGLGDTIRIIDPASWALLIGHVKDRRSTHGVDLGAGDTILNYRRAGPKPGRTLY